MGEGASDGGRRFEAVLLDVDGTIVDSNEAHVRAWVRALERGGFPVPPERVRRAVGMGGDNLLPEVAGVEKDSPDGERMSAWHTELFKTEYQPRVRAFPRVRELVERLRAEGLRVVCASSAHRDELDRSLEIAGIADLVQDATTADDAENSKPDPDVVLASLDKAGSAPGRSVMLGDTPYDVQAAARAGVATIALRSGGFGDEDLRGAIAIYDDVAHLLAEFDRSPFADRA